MRVLVTGGAGFIGSWVRQELARRAMTPVSYDRPDDILHRRAIARAARGVDAVINLAGSLGTAELFDDEFGAIQANIVGAVNVYQAAAAAGLPVVQVATGHRGQPNPYAITKAAAEDLALARVRYRDQPISVVRAYHVYGPGQKMCPPHGKSPVRKIVPSFVARAVTGMPLEINGSGEQTIDLVWVGDVAKVLVDALHGPWGRVVEAGTGKPTTVLQAAADIIDATGSASPVVHLPMRPGEPEDAAVVAAEPLCHNAWPHRLDETITWYRERL